MTPWAGGHVPGCGHVSHIVKMHYFLIIFLSTLGDGSDKHKKAVLMICTLIPIVFKNRLFCSFPLPLMSFIYSMMGLLIG